MPGLQWNDAEVPNVVAVPDHIDERQLRDSSSALVEHEYVLRLVDLTLDDGGRATYTESPEPRLRSGQAVPSPSSRRSRRR